MKRFPVRVDRGHTVLEATCIIEYLDLFHAGPVQLIPKNSLEALEVRMLDRFFDNYIATPQQKVVFDVLRPPGNQDPTGGSEARTMLDMAYGWLDRHMAGRE